MRTLNHVLQQIESVKAKLAELEVEADGFRKRERVAVIERIREAVTTYGLTADDIMGKPKKAKADTKRGAAGRKVANANRAKRPQQPRLVYVRGQVYSDGTHTWKGYGMVPKWLRKAAGNRPLSDFVVDPTIEQRVA